MKIRILLAFLIAAVPLGACAQGRNAPGQEQAGVNYVTTPQDSLFTVGLLSSLSDYSVRVRSERDDESPSVPELMLEAGRLLMGQPYVAGSLDEGEKEAVGIFPTKQDCIIFVETCLDLALAVKQSGAEADAAMPETETPAPAPSFEDFASLVLLSRYRDGRAERYSDRIHYTTEWIRHNEARGVLKDITLEAGGETYDHPIDYMGTHPEAYAHLKDAATDTVARRDLEVIRSIEAELNEVPMTYIPKAKVESAYAHMAPGDIICFVSGIKGLDISHVGIYLGGGRFMHASSAKMKVVADGLSVADYIRPKKNHVGIKVVRPL